jgi:glycosyltransferase involved in cell wall biosynthesis
MPPKITILTPSFNRASMIVKAIDSVLAQNYPSFEHVIIDGGSTDGTLGLLARYPHIKIISEPDQGMYDALNKGLGIATGEIIGFLNTDDFYEPNIFSKIAKFFTENNIDAVVGIARYFTVNPNGAREYFSHTTPPLPQRYWHELIIGNPAFNAWFFKKNTFNLLGRFDTIYKIAGDRDLLYRFAFFGLRYEAVEEVFYHYRYHPGSLSMNQDWLHFSKVINENLQLVNHFSKDPRMPHIALAQLSQLRTRETITATFRSARSGNWHQAITYSMLGFRSDYFWLLKFMLRSIEGIVRAIVRIFVDNPPQV